MQALTVVPALEVVKSLRRKLKRQNLRRTECFYFIFRDIDRFKANLKA